MNKKVLDAVASSALGQQIASFAYTCPMHPEIQQGKPGTCPKCGMTLVEAEKNVSAPKE